MLLAEVNGDRVNYQEAMKATDRLKWTEAIKEEIESMYKNTVTASDRIISILNGY